MIRNFCMSYVPLFMLLTGYLNNKKVNSFFRTFYGFRLYAGDGSLFEIPDKELTLKDKSLNFVFKEISGKSSYMKNVKAYVYQFENVFEFLWQEVLTDYILFS